MDQSDPSTPSSSTSGPTQNARKTCSRAHVQVHHTYSFLHQNQWFQSQIKVQTTNYIILFTKFKMIDHGSRNQSKKIEKIIKSWKTKSSPNHICFKIKQVYTSDVRSGQLWTWLQALNPMKQAKLWRIKIWKLPFELRYKLNYGL